MKHYFFAALVLHFLTPGFAQNNLKEYCNDRFSFCIQYLDGFIGQGESENSDGQRFLSKDKQAEITSYGMLVLEGVNDDLNEQFKQASEGINVTYKVVKPEWFILSGTDSKGNIIYRKTTLKKISYLNEEKPETKVLQTLTITYRASQQKLYGSYCNVVAKGF
jgi:hypothetical protein